MSYKITDLMLERYLLCECSDGERKEIELAISFDPALRTKVERMREENRRFELRKFVPTVSVNKSIYQYLTLPQWQMALVSTVFLFVFVSASLQYFVNPSRDYRTKGAAMVLNAYQLVNGDVLKLDPEQAHTPSGSLIQLSYQLAEESYGVIFSIDGRGKLTVHYPDHEKNLPRLEANKEVFLPSSMQLDDAPDVEVFYLVTFERSVSLSTIIEHIQTINDRKKLKEGNFTIPHQIGVKTLILKK